MKKSKQIVIVSPYPISCKAYRANGKILICISGMPLDEFNKLPTKVKRALEQIALDGLNA